MDVIGFETNIIVFASSEKVALFATKSNHALGFFE